MSDPLDELKAALRHATPAPDAARKADTLAMARKSFEAAQGSGAGARPKDDRPGRAGLFERTRRMFATLHRPTSYGALGATTALVAVGLVVSLPGLREAALPPEPAVFVEEVEADFAATPALDTLGNVAALERAAPQAAPSPVAPAAGTRHSGTERRLKTPPGAAMAPRQVILGDQDRVHVPEAETEAFANAEASPLKITAEDPVSTFSVDVDTASWAVIRSSLSRGQLPPPEAVRIEEAVNYFPYAYPAPEAGTAPFRPTVQAMETPWNPGTRLVRIGLQGQMPAVEDRPPLNLVFLIDTSGSMAQPDKLPLLVQSLRLMLAELRPEDQIAIVTYAGSAGVALDPVPASDRRAIEAALAGLTSGGSTAGQAGLEEAYRLADEMTGAGEVSRVLLATDGDFNVGLSDPAALEDYIAGKRDSGTYLSVLGFGRGNLDDTTMQALAQNGNGTAAYIDTLSEARKVLVDQVTGALFPIADDVKIQVEWNPATVAEYRLIGYETRALRREDFANDRVDAGEIGAGHQVTALYEITPAGSDARLTDDLRYGAAAVDGPEGEFGFLRLRWKAPGAETSQLLEQPILAETAAGDTDLRFAAAIAGFGQILRGGTYIGDWSIGDAVALAEGATGDDRFGYRREAVDLMRLAAALLR